MKDPLDPLPRGEREKTRVTECTQRLMKGMKGELPDMMSASEGGGGQGKEDVVRKFYTTNQIQMRTGGVKKSKNFADIISGSSQATKVVSSKGKQNFPQALPNLAKIAMEQQLPTSPTAPTASTSSPSVSHGNQSNSSETPSEGGGGEEGDVASGAEVISLSVCGGPARGLFNRKVTSGVRRDGARLIFYK